MDVLATLVASLSFKAAALLAASFLALSGSGAVLVARAYGRSRWWAAWQFHEPQIRAALRERVLADDYARRDRRDESVASIDRKLEAVQDACTAHSEALKAHGREMAEIPRLSVVLEQLDATIASVDTTLANVLLDVRTLSERQQHTSGLIEGWRDRAAHVRAADREEEEEETPHAPERRRRPPARRARKET